MTANKTVSSLAALSDLGVIDVIRVSDLHVEVLELHWEELERTHLIPLDVLDSDEMSATLTRLAAEHAANSATKEELDAEYHPARAWDSCSNSLAGARRALSAKKKEIKSLNASIDALLAEGTAESMAKAARKRSHADNISRKIPELEEFVQETAERLAAMPNLDDESRERINDATRRLRAEREKIRKTAVALIEEFADRG